LSERTHFHVPEKKEYYTHRSGRNARAGKTGLSLSFVSPKELPDLKSLSYDLGFLMKELPR